VHAEISAEDQAGHLAHLVQADWGVFEWLAPDSALIHASWRAPEHAQVGTVTVKVSHGVWRQYRADMTEACVVLSEVPLRFSRIVRERALGSSPATKARRCPGWGSGVGQEFLCVPARLLPEVRPET
jgi:hypothetical protein